MNEHQGYFEVFFCLMLLRPCVDRNSFKDASRRTIEQCIKR